MYGVFDKLTGAQKYGPFSCKYRAKERAEQLNARIGQYRYTVRQVRI